ncbi:MAG: DoxX family membrane protein [Pseudonocardia sp.]
MERNESYGKDVALVVVRLVVGFFSVYHGMQQIVGMADFTFVVSRLGVPLPAVVAWLAVLGQIGLGGLLILGLFTRVVGILMTVLFLLIHYSYYVNRFDDTLSLLGNGTLWGVESLSYAATGVFFACVGAGLFALDGVLSSALRRRGIRTPGLVRFLWPDDGQAGKSRYAPVVGSIFFQIFIGALVVLQSVRQLIPEQSMTNLMDRMSAAGLPVPNVLAWVTTLALLVVGVLLVLGLFSRASGALLALVAAVLFIAVPERGGTVVSEGGGRQVGFHGEEFVFLAAIGVFFAIVGARQLSQYLRTRRTTFDSETAARSTAVDSGGATGVRRG